MKDDIWTSRHGRVWYSFSDLDYHLSSACEIVKFQFLNKPNTCEYCGHDVLEEEQCPGCAARKSDTQKLTAGKATVTIVGLMPFCAWLLHNPKKLEYHIIDCGRPDIFDYYIGRIVMDNIIPTGKALDGMAGRYEENAIQVIVTFECDVLIEDNF